MTEVYAALSGKSTLDVFVLIGVIDVHVRLMRREGHEVDQRGGQLAKFVLDAFILDVSRDHDGNRSLHLAPLGRSIAHLRTEGNVPFTQSARARRRADLLAPRRSP